MKNFLYLSCLALLLSSCFSSRKSRASKVIAPTATAMAEPEREETSPPPLSGAHVKTVSTRSDAISRKAFSENIERSNPLQFKYGILLGTDVEDVNDRRLYTFIDEWYGTPYKYGGNTRAGVDCSGFASMLMDSVFDVPIPRTCKAQYQAGRKIKRAKLFPGDLVFFNTTGKFTHVGVFLGNNKFVHASTSNGVMISDLDDFYFRKRYAAAVRVR